MNVQCIDGFAFDKIFRLFFSLSLCFFISGKFRLFQFYLTVFNEIFVQFVISFNIENTFRCFRCSVSGVLHRHKCQYPISWILMLKEWSEDRRRTDKCWKRKKDNIQSSNNDVSVYIEVNLGLFLVRSVFLLLLFFLWFSAFCMFQLPILLIYWLVFFLHLLLLNILVKSIIESLFGFICRMSCRLHILNSSKTFD